MNRVKEVHVIYRGRDDRGAGVPTGSDGTTDVDEVHDATADQVTERIGVVEKC